MRIFHLPPGERIYLIDLRGDLGQIGGRRIRNRCRRKGISLNAGERVRGRSPHWLGRGCDLAPVALVCVDPISCVRNMRNCALALRCIFGFQGPGSATMQRDWSSGTLSVVPFMGVLVPLPKSVDIHTFWVRKHTIGSSVPEELGFGIQGCRLRVVHIWT